MTSLLHFWHSKQSTRLVLGPESWLARHTCTVWVFRIVFLSSGWNCLSGLTSGKHWMGMGVGGYPAILSAGDNTVHRLPRGLKGLSGGIQCPWEVRSQLKIPQQPFLCLPNPSLSVLPAVREMRAPEKQHQAVGLWAQPASLIYKAQYKMKMWVPCSERQGRVLSKV